MLPFRQKSSQIQEAGKPLRVLSMVTTARKATTQGTQR